MIGRVGSGRVLLILALAAVELTAPRVPALARTNADSLAGRWQWSLHASCTVTPANQRACVEILAMGLHVYAIRATRMTYRGSDSIVVDSRGHFTETGSATFSGRSPGAPNLKVCEPSAMESALFQKTCIVTPKGTGHIAKGGTYLLDFFTDRGRITYPNRKITYFEDYHDIGDSLIPAVPGEYNNSRYLSLVAYAKYLPGVSVHLTVKHLSQRSPFRAMRSARTAEPAISDRSVPTAMKEKPRAS